MRRFCVAGIVLAACAADPAPARSVDETFTPPPVASTRSTPDPLLNDPDGFEPLPPVAATGWRARFRGPGQTYLDYLDTIPRRPRPGRDRLYLLPLTELGTSMVVDAEYAYIVRTPSPDAMRTMVAAFYGLDVEVLPTLPLTAVSEPDRIRRGHEQYHAQSLLRATAPRLPADAYSMTSLMVRDLFFDEEQAYGFGFGQHRDGQAIVSFSRIDPVVSGLAREPDVHERLPLRAFKLLVHEVGHTFGFEHCTAYRCVMNGVADLPELDATPLHLCPDCLQKLMHAQPHDPMERYTKLAELYGSLDLESPRAWMEGRLARLQEREPARPPPP